VGGDDGKLLTTKKEPARPGGGKGGGTKNNRAGGESGRKRAKKRRAHSSTKEVCAPRNAGPWIRENVKGKKKAPRCGEEKNTFTKKENVLASEKYRKKGKKCMFFSSKGGANTFFWSGKKETVFFPNCKGEKKKRVSQPE